MLKNIIILSVLYTLIILGITLQINSMSKYYIPLLLIVSLLFMFLLTKEIFKKFSSNFKPASNPPISYKSFDNTDGRENLKKISERPFFFGMEKKLINNEDFYFDEANFYAINTNGEKTIFPLNNIT